jgi:hypothetical protein
MPMWIPKAHLQLFLKIPGMILSHSGRRRVIVLHGIVHRVLEDVGLQNPVKSTLLAIKMARSYLLTQRLVTGPRQSKVASDLASGYVRLPGSSKISDESFKLVGRSSLEIDNTAREHPLYHNVQPKADGLYHCPFEDDPKANCTHKPEKLKCNYEYTLFPQFLGDQH